MGRHELKPLFDHVVIKELEPDRMRSPGWSSPPASRSSRPSTGSSSRSAGAWTGGRRPACGCRCGPGDHVVFPATAGSWVEVDEERLLVCRVTELLGILETVDESSPIESKD